MKSKQIFKTIHNNKYNKLFFFNFLLILIVFSNLSFACFTPVGDDNIILTDVTFCKDNYSLFDDEDGYEENYSLFIINASNIIFDCNSSTIDGNSNGQFIKTNWGVSNITIKNCNIVNFVGGIGINLENSTLRNLNFTNITNFGTGGEDLDRDAIKLDSSNNVLIDNIIINGANTGIDFGYGLENIVVNNTKIYNVAWRGFNAFSSINSKVLNSYVENSEIAFNDATSINLTLDNLSMKNISDIGVNFYGTSSSTLKNSNISNLNTTAVLIRKRSSVIASGNIIFNNYFSNNTVHINTSDQLLNYFNTTLFSGTNIIGGVNIGGNFYDDYIGSDSNSDGIGESNYEIVSNGSLVYDYLPLTNNVSSSSSTKTFNVTILNDSNFNESGSIHFQINFSNTTGQVNLKVSSPCNRTYPNIYDGWDFNCQIVKDGKYNITFDITDDEDQLFENKSLDIINVIPYNLSQVSQANQNRNFTFNLSFNDPGLSDLFNISIGWGDSNYTYINNTYSRTHTVNHIYLIDGNYTINFTVKDDDNLSEVFSFNITLVQDEFKTILSNQTINIDDNASLELSIKNIDSLTDLNIDWGDSNYTYITSGFTNRSKYYHNYSSFGNFTVNSSIKGCKSGGICITATTYTATMWVNVIGYGDGIINGDENCDTNNFNGKTCSNYGFNSGTLSCNSGVINTSDCYTESSGGGGHHSSSNDDEEIEIEVNESIENNSTIINQSRKLCHETFEFKSNKIDYLIALDRSESMNNYQIINLLESNEFIPYDLLQRNNIDYHIGIVIDNNGCFLTDTYKSNLNLYCDDNLSNEELDELGIDCNNFIVNSDSISKRDRKENSMIDIDDSSANILVDNNGHPSHRYSDILSHSYNALRKSANGNCNVNFLRDDAFLSVILISDYDSNSIDNFGNILTSLKGSSDYFNVNYIGIPDDFMENYDYEECENLFSNSISSTNYYLLSKFGGSGGSFSSICGSYDKVKSSVKSIFSNNLNKNLYHLNNLVIDKNNISIKFNENIYTNWDFNSLSNIIEFKDSANLNYGDKFEISYLCGDNFVRKYNSSLIQPEVIVNLSKCGNGYLDEGEECDLGNRNSNTANSCKTNCKLPFCGDGFLDDGYYESCDDGNLINGDGCSDTCQNENISERRIQNLSIYDKIPGINLTLPVVKNNSKIFDFVPYIDTIFNFFEIEFPYELFDFKPRISLIFNGFKNEINWSNNTLVQYDFVDKMNLVFDDFVEKLK